MNRGRYEAYVDARTAIAAEVSGPATASLLSELAEALLLSRGRAESTALREQAAPAVASAVELGELSRPAADRLWGRLAACGPPMYWPPSWDRSLFA